MNHSGSRMPGGRSRLVIAFDADDTLWHNEANYKQALQQLETLLREAGSAADVSAALAEAESRNISWYGYGIKSYTLSMIETAAAILGERLTGSLVEAILQVGRAMLNADVMLFEHTHDVLAHLAIQHDLLLITKGDLLEQDNKVKRSGVAGYFRSIEIVHEKNPDGYRAVLSRHGIQAAEFVMVGNSLRSDILPVLEIGGRAVYVPYQLTWAHEHADPSGHSYYEIADLGLLPDLIARIDAGT